MIRHTPCTKDGNDPPTLDTVDTIHGKGYVSGDLTYGIKHHAVGIRASYQRVQDGKLVSTQWVEVGPIP